MRNVLRTLEKVTQKSVPLTEESLGMDPQMFMEIAANCGFEPTLTPSKAGYKVKLKCTSIPVVMLYDGTECNRFNFLDLGDLHAGHPKFDARELDKVLSKYYKNGKPSVDYVFIAGDLVDGITTDYYTFEMMNEDKSERQRVIQMRSAQVNQLLAILEKYDFDYRVINGNHEYGFHLLGLESPLRLLEKKMRERGKRFTYYDTYIVDFIIAGVCKRMMHLESFNTKPGVIATYDRLRRFKKNGGLMVRYNGKRYPVRFFQCGHLHHRQEMYDGGTRIFITQPGSFIKSDIVYSPGILVRGRVVNNKNIIRE